VKGKKNKRSWVKFSTREIARDEEKNRPGIRLGNIRQTGEFAARGKGLSDGEG